MDNPTPQAPRRSLVRNSLIAAGLVAGGIVIGASGLALAAAGNMGWSGGFGHGARIGFFQHVVRGALENVGATTVQEDKIHDIIATTFTTLDKNGADREAVRKQVFELMKAPTLDRAAFEKLRIEKVTDIDTKSKTVVGALIEAASQLTPEQRAKLVQNAEERMAHGWGPGGWGGWHHRDRMDQDGPHHGPDGDDHG